MSSPYRNNIDFNFNSSEHVKIRWQKTLKFLEENKAINNGLDIGDRTDFTMKLEKFQCLRSHGKHKFLLFTCCCDIFFPNDTKPTCGA